MSQESEGPTQGQHQPEEAAAPEESSKAQEMFLGKLKITDGKTVSYCQWTVVGAGEQWAYSLLRRPRRGGHAGQGLRSFPTRLALLRYP